MRWLAQMVIRSEISVDSILISEQDFSKPHV